MSIYKNEGMSGNIRLMYFHTDRPSRMYMEISRSPPPHPCLDLQTPRTVWPASVPESLK